MSATCRPNCGGCCDPVTIPYTQNEAHALYLRGEISEDEHRWVTEVLVPMRPKEAKAIASYLFEGQMRNAVGMNPGEIITFYYRCSWFDRDTRTCTHYDERPTVCSRYPWVYGYPIPNAALPPMCSYNADIGRPVEDVPVAWLGRKHGADSSTPVAGGGTDGDRG